uniref:Calponin-homology (CH) domain-containing protein n=1 Tax=Haemonchus contortus TaxID=6289 RepID=A0A7I4Y0I6_HAECO
MCPELSPVKWRRRSWRSIVSARRENVVFSSVPVATRVQELERREQEMANNNDMNSLKEMLQRLIDMQLNSQLYNGKVDNSEANASEELQATLNELQEVRQTLLSFERRYAAVQKKNEKLEADLTMMKRELDLMKSDVHTCRKSSSRWKTWRLSQSFDDSVLCCDGASDSKVQVRELKEEIAMLNKELEKRDAIIETERAQHKAQLKDFIAAVKVAERHREEAQAELNRMNDANRTIPSPDEAIWDDLMQKFQKSTKRNALLAWAEAHLTAYPSISVSNFTSDWCDGRAFCALIHHFQPEMIERASLLQREKCPELAVQLASKLEIHIHPTTFGGSRPDFKYVMEAVFELYKKLELRDREC